MPSNPEERAYLLTEQLARRWQISPRTLERLRYEGKGVPYVKICGRVLYPLDLIKTYEAAGLVEPETLPAKRK